MNPLFAKLCDRTETKASDFSASTALVSPESLQALKVQIKLMRERIILAEQVMVLTALESKSLRDADQSRHQDCTRK